MAGPSVSDTKRPSWAADATLVERAVERAVATEDQVSFVRLLARNPEMVSPAGPVHNCLRAARDSRSKAARDALLALGSDGDAEEDEEEEEEEWTGPATKKRGLEKGENGEVKRLRRSGRGGAGRKTGGLGVGKKKKKKALEAEESGKEVEIGPEYQAEVPALPSIPHQFADEVPGGGYRRLMPCAGERVLGIESKVMFVCPPGGESALESFLKKVNVDLLRRDGFPLSPMNEQRALEIYFDCNYDVGKARALALVKIPKGTQYPGAGPPWKLDELCVLARTLAESSRNFEHISRNVLPHRSTRELVVHYYTRHKQEWSQFGGRKQSLMFDRGIEPAPRMNMGPELVVDFLHALAQSAGDGFPVERRMRDAVMSARNTLVKKNLGDRARAADAERGSRIRRDRTGNRG